MRVERNVILISHANQKKLTTLFGTLPESALRQLYGAFESQFEAGIDESMPWDVLSDLVRDAMARRGIYLPLVLPEAKEEKPTAELPRVEPVQDDSVLDLTSPLPKPVIDPPEETIQADNVVTDFDEMIEFASDENEAEASGEAALDEPVLEELLLTEEPVFEASVSETAVNETAEDQEPEAAPAIEPEPSLEVPELVRPRNAMHAFFLPLETLIIDPPKFTDRINGFICSTSLPPIWRLLNEERSGAAIRDAWIKFELQSGRADEDLQHQITSNMYEAAGQVLQEVIASSAQDDKQKRQLATRLGGEAVVEDLKEVALLIERAWALQQFVQQYLPEGLNKNNDLEKLATTILSQDAHATVNIRASIQRSSDWSTVIALQSYLEDASTGAPSPELLQIIPDYLETSLIKMGAWLDVQVTLDPIDKHVLKINKTFVSLTAALRGSDAAFIKGQLAVPQAEGVKAAGDIFDRLMRQAQLALRDALPVAGSGENAKAPNPDWILTNPAVEFTIDRAMLAAKFMASGYKMAAVLKKTAHYQRVMSPTLAQLEAYCSDLVALISQSPAQISPEKRLVAVKFSEHVLALSDILLGEQHTDALRHQVNSVAETA